MMMIIYQIKVSKLLLKEIGNNAKVKTVQKREQACLKSHTNPGPYKNSIKKFYQRVFGCT